MRSVTVVLKDISHKYARNEALDAISVQFTQGFTRASCVIAILTRTILVLSANPEHVLQRQSAVPILESCTDSLCSFRCVSHNVI